MKTRYVVALAIVAALAGSLLSRPMWAVADRMTAGTYLISFSDEGGSSGDIGMLAMFTNTGQIITADRTDFGWMPEGASNVLEENCGSEDDVVIQANQGKPVPDELQGPGFGSWSINAADVQFMVMSYRYGPDGAPIGTLRATGRGRPGADGNIRGKSQLDFLPSGADVVADEPACSVETSFEGIRIPSDKQKKADKGDRGDTGGGKGGNDGRVD